MLLALGSHQFDITHRAIVLGIVDPDVGESPDELLRVAESLVGAGAAALTVGGIDGDGLVAAVAALRKRFDEPVVVRTSSVPVASACFAEGAVGGHDDGGVADAAYLSAAAAAGASVVVTRADRSGDIESIVAGLEASARAAESVGIPAERIVFDAGVGRERATSPSLDLLRNHDRLASLGWPVLVSARDERARRRNAEHAVGIIRGARILRTRHVRSARRIAEVAARLLEARDDNGQLRKVS